MSKLAVAIVGCGRVADYHLEAWHKVKEAKVIAACDIYEEVARQFVQRWKIPHYYTDLETLLDKEEGISIVDICTPPQTHRDLSIQAMKTGRNVLLEKPLAMTTLDAEIIATQKPKDVKASVVHNLLFDPSVLELSSIVKRGQIGDINSIEIDMLHTKYDPMILNEKDWCHNILGGRFGEILPHPIYLLHHFLNDEIDILGVETRKLGPYAWASSDELYVLIESRGRFGKIYISFNSPRDAIYIRIIGSEGIVETELITGTIMKLSRFDKLWGGSRFDKGKFVMNLSYQLLLSLAKNATKVLFGLWETGHQRIIRLFAESVLKNIEPPITIEDGLKNVKIVEKICREIDRKNDYNLGRN